MATNGASAFHELLRHHREASGCSRAALAARAGLSARRITDLEAGSGTLPTQEVVAALADGLALSAEERITFLAAARAPVLPPAAGDVPAEVRLPRPLTSFIGRERDVEQVQALVRRDNVRLVTLTGPGGVGKTRLALRVADDLGETFDDGIAFVDLAPIRTPNLVAETVASVLGIRETAEHTVSERLIDVLQNRHLLLVLDNFEHVVEAAPLVTRLLASCPRVKALVTSRIALRLSGERVMIVEPLALPAHVDRPVLSELMASEAVVLFADRAQEVRVDFAISEGNALGVAEICRRVDGLPLAVELAAARIAHLPLPALLARLERCLPLLTGGARDLPERQRTLKGTITWSHDLLTLDEQILFRRLAVFLGGFTLEAAAAVAHAPIDLALDVFDGITTLVANSLLRQLEDANGAPRYVMLETIREYGLERLVESGEEEAVRREHAAFFMVFSEFGKTSPDWPGDLTWLTALEQEEANLRTALAWAVSRSEAEIGLRLIAAVGGSWDVRGRLREERSWLEQVLAISEGAASERRLVVSIRLAWNAFLLGDEVAARVIAEQSLTDARSLGDEGHAANALHVLGTLAGDRQEFDRAELLLAEAELLMRRNDDRCALAWILNHAGVMAAVQGDFERAMTCYEESLGLWRDLGNTWGLAHLQFNLAWLVRNQGDAKRAAELDREALIAFWKLKAESGLSLILGDAAELVLKAGDATRAARLGGASAHLRERTGTVVQAVSMVEYEHYVNATRANLGEAAFAATWAAGEALTLSEAVTEAEAVFIAVSNTTASPSVPPPLGLSPREREVLCLIAAGRSNREIADTLFISLPTAKVHVRSILTKLDLDSRTAAAAFAIRHNLA